jgi:hypothetical protein
VISPLVHQSSPRTGGQVNHSYADHVSLVKFIERNWRLDPHTDRSRYSPLAGGFGSSSASTALG